MELKDAKSANDSSTLKAAKGSDKVLIGLIIGAFGLAGAWIFTPQNIKDKIAPVGLSGLGVLGFILKNFNTSIKNGRLNVGDLEGAVANYALLKPGELANANIVKPFIEGNLALHQIPVVQAEIERQVAAKTRSFEESIKLAQLKPVTFPADVPAALPVVPAGVVIPTPKPGLAGVGQERKHSLSDLATIAQGSL
jgi:hypothetical protein